MKTIWKDLKENQLILQRTNQGIVPNALHGEIGRPAIFAEHIQLAEWCLEFGTHQACNGRNIKGLELSKTTMLVYFTRRG